MRDQPATPATDVWSVHCDGGAVPNPGRMGWGVVMVAPDGQKHLLSQATHLTGCNNEAEVRALMAALAELKRHQATRLHLHSDNSILVEQLTVPHCKPVARLAGLFDEARALLATFEHVRLTWIPRHRNGEADALARAALGLPPFNKA
jgi:ribonuclease HI